MSTTLRRAALACVVVAVWMSAPVAQAASFDCGKAHSPMEHMICGDAGLSQLDEQLAATYRQAVARDPQVRQQEQAWLRETQARCTTTECLKAAYQERLQALGGTPQATPTPSTTQNPAQPLVQAPAAPQTNTTTAETDAAAQAQAQEQAQAQAAAAQRAAEEAQRQQAIEARNQADAARRQAEIAQAQAERQQAQQKDDRERNLWILGAIVVLVLGGWIWNKFVRNRCPECKSTKYDVTGRQELDRWTGTKQVTEKHSRGTNTRHVRTTYVMMQYAFRCKACQHEWVKDRKEEKGAFSVFDKFLSGFWG
jgi:uncharacterized protein